MNKLFFTNQEYHKILSIDNTVKLYTHFSDSKTYELSINDEKCEDIYEKIQDAYVYEGFDSNYNHNPEGELLWKIMEKFQILGW